MKKRNEKHESGFSPSNGPFRTPHRGPKLKFSHQKNVTFAAITCRRFFQVLASARTTEKRKRKKEKKQLKKRKWNNNKKKEAKTREKNNLGKTKEKKNGKTNAKQGKPLNISTQNPRRCPGFAVVVVTFFSKTSSKISLFFLGMCLFPKKIRENFTTGPPNLS